MRPIVYRRAAIDDLLAIGEYITARNPAAAKRVAERIRRTIHGIIADFPESGRQSEEDTREFVVSGLPYVVIYRFDEDQIEIVAVFHTSRDPATKRKA